MPRRCVKPAPCGKWPWFTARINRATRSKRSSKNVASRPCTLRFGAIGSIYDAGALDLTPGLRAFSRDLENEEGA